MMSTEGAGHEETGSHSTPPSSKMVFLANAVRLQLPTALSEVHAPGADASAAAGRKCQSPGAKPFLC